MSDVKCKTIHGEGSPSMSTRIVRARVAKVSDRKVYNHLNLKILSPKEMQQRLPIALAQVKAGNTTENLPNEA